MASYQPVSQNEVVAVINEDETFANDRDKSDAKTHHLELDRTGRHHLVSPQISTLVKTTIPANAAAATTPLGSVGKNGAGFNNYKPNNAVTFKLTDNDFIDKILPVKGLFFTKSIAFSLIQWWCLSLATFCVGLREQLLFATCVDIT